MAEGRAWPALVVRAPDRERPWDDLVAVLLDDHEPAAIEDLAEQPLPPGGVWDPTAPPPDVPPATPLAWRVFFRDPRARDEAAADLRRRYPALACTATSVADEDWAARSQRDLAAVRAGDFLVAPPWDVPASVPDGVTLIVIEPSTGFGTGHHQSTRLCLRALSALDVAGLDVLDIGTGSGVLALAAASRGAATVRALDVDEDAVAAARDSAARNPGLPAVEWIVGDLRTQPVAPADLVLANLTGGLLERAAADIRRASRPGARLVVSGFVEAEADRVAGALGGPVLARYTEDDWVALVLAP
ncbi:MAG: 50S ribosomal protein L11 methyltransferase [Vicinamibacterales bacterium]